MDLKTQLTARLHEQLKNWTHDDVPTCWWTQGVTQLICGDELVGRTVLGSYRHLSGRLGDSLAASLQTSHVWSLRRNPIADVSGYWSLPGRVVSHGLLIGLSGRKLIDMLSSCLWRFSESSLLHVEVGAPGDVFPVFSQSYLSCRCCCWESCQPGSDCQLFVLFCPHYSFICWAAVMESDEVCDADVTHHSEEVCVSDRGPPWIKWRHHFVF